MRLHCPKSWVGGARSSGIVDCLQRRGLRHRQRSSDALRRTMLIFLIEEVFSISRKILLSDISTFLLCIAFVYKKINKNQKCFEKTTVSLRFLQKNWQKLWFLWFKGKWSYTFDNVLWVCDSIVQNLPRTDRILLSTILFSKGIPKKWQGRFVLEARYCQNILWDKNGDMWSTKHSP